MQQRMIEELESVTIRFCGDSGDGMQLTGMRFTDQAALLGNDIATFPDFPAEIRAPAGSLPGVSGFQIQFSSRDIHTPGDQPDVLVAMNPAALRTNLRDLPQGGTLFVNADAFTPANLKLAGYETSPLEDGSLAPYRVFQMPMTGMTLRAVEETGLSKKLAERCKNFFALGVMFWLYDRPVQPTLEWIDQNFGKKPEVAEANKSALRAGYNYADTLEIFNHVYRVKKAELQPGTYRSISGNQALAMGLVAAAKRAERPLFYGSYPITPASDVLHELSKHKAFDVKTFQAEDEIAAIGAALGAAFGGAVAVTGTSGPGVCLKSEAMGLAVMTGLPLVILDIQRGGPSTGLPTKTEQADLLQVMFGRNGECPMPILAASTPGDCFWMAFEAIRIAVKYMTPVVLLSDGYLANGAEPWKIPAVEELPRIPVVFAKEPDGFLPYKRNSETLARPWAIPGTPYLEHRIGGIEKQDGTGNVNYEPANHHHMVTTRAAKVAGIAKDIPALKAAGPDSGDLLILGWGGTYGAIASAGEQLRKDGHAVATAHLRYLNPFPANLGDVLKRYKRVMIPELNLGQLALLVRGRFLVDAQGFNKVAGQPFKVAEIVEAARRVLAGKPLV